MLAFFKTHKYLLDNLNVPIRRGLMQKVNWDRQLVGIIGARGVGKTTFLLDFIATHYGDDTTCLYVNLNNLYFSNRTIISFADEFQKTGGKRLVLDQVFKYPNWASELEYCTRNFPNLKIVFCGTPLMLQPQQVKALNGKAAIYNLEGFSFREYLNYKSGFSFSSYTLDEILTKHQAIASDIIAQVKPLAYFNDYLHHGYYPCFLHNDNHIESLVKNINLVLEIDISYLQQIELKYLPKLRKLLYLISCQAPFQPNVSKLSVEVETSRATIINYLKYLKEAEIIQLLYGKETDLLKKPSEILLQNSNLYFAVAGGEVKKEHLYKTFFCNQMGYRYHLNYSKVVDFVVESHYLFKLGATPCMRQVKKQDVWNACYMLEVGSDKTIPLWLFGFLD